MVCRQQVLITYIIHIIILYAVIRWQCIFLDFKRLADALFN